MNKKDEIRIAIILLIVNIFLTIKSISVTYKAAKYSIEGNINAINLFVEVLDYSTIFIFLSIIFIIVGFLYEKDWCNKIAILLLIVGMVVLFVPYI